MFSADNQWLWLGRPMWEGEISRDAHILYMPHYRDTGTATVSTFPLPWLHLPDTHLSTFVYFNL